MSHVPIIPHAATPSPHPKRSRQVLRRLARLAVAVVIGLPGCGLFSPEDPVIGIIDFDHAAWPLPQIPETATAGVPLEMAIWTGGGGCYRQGYTEVEVDGRSAVVTPYDFRTTGGGDCPLLLAIFEHRTTVVFKEPGTAEIVLVYRGERGVGRKAYTVEVAEAGST